MCVCSESCVCLCVYIYIYIYICICVLKVMTFYQRGYRNKCKLNLLIAESAGAVEYTNCTSAEG